MILRYDIDTDAHVEASQEDWDALSKAAQSLAYFLASQGLVDQYNEWKQAQPSDGPVTQDDITPDPA